MTLWRITGGTPTAEETAAVTAVLTALLAQRTAAAQEEAQEEESTGSGWHRRHRNPHSSAGMWRGR
ncbi:MAG: acyl-CoA carboxylase subunit epsilon [Streptomyces sp.]|nr:acyl-CoA carboxylase subunit epsilon [Streptomyces sp.]